MYEGGLRNFYWGFLFIMIDFRLMGFDILPDIVGYLLFAAGLSALLTYSPYFAKAQKLNLPMIFLSLFAIYEQPAQGNGLQLGQWGILGFIIGIAATVLSLVVIYHLFMGIKDLAEQHDKPLLAKEAEDRWGQYLILSLIGLFSIVLIIMPGLMFIVVIGLLIGFVVLTFVIMAFIKRCWETIIPKS